MHLCFQRIRAVLFGVAALSTTLALVGCAPPKYTDFDAFIKSPRPLVGGKPYVLEPPDSLRVISPGAPEIDGQGGRIRPDGYITLHLLGDIFVAGKTPSQLGAEIEEKILRYYQDVSVQVEVTGFNSKRYYMAGEAGQGPRSYTGKDTILDAVLAGQRRSAWPEKLTILRPNEQGELIRRMTINFRDMYERGDLKYNAVLEVGDIIFMPINPLAALGVMVGNLLQPISPVIRAATTPQRVGNTQL